MKEQPPIEEKSELEMVDVYQRALNSADTALYMRDKYLELAREAVETYTDPEAVRELNLLIKKYESKFKKE